MANSDASFGLRPVRHRNGAPYNGAANPYYVPSSYATALFIGDPVKTTGTSNTAEVSAPGAGNFPAGSLPEINRAGATGDITGVIVGFAADATSLENQYNPASTERIVFVADDPELMFEVQEDSDTSTLAATSVGLNANVIFTNAGSTTSGQSGAELDSSTAATTATLQLRLERLANRADNEVGANAKWLVSILQHSALNSTGV